MPWRHQAGRTLGTAFAVHAALIGTWAGRVPAIKHALHLTDARLGVALFGMAAGTLAGSWAGGRLARRLGPARLVQAGIPAMAAALFTGALAGSLAELCLALLCFGTIGAVVDVGMNALAVAVERDQGRPQMSGLHGGWSAGLLLGALIASGAAAAGIGPRAHFAVVGAAAAAAAVLLLRRLPRGEPTRRGRVPRVPWPAGLVALGLVAFCSFFAEGSVSDWSAVYMHDRAGAGAALAAAAFAGFSLTMVAARFFGDRVVAAIGPVALTRRAATIAAAGMALVLAVPVPAAGMVGFGMMGVGLAPIVPTVLSAVGGGAATGVESAISRVLLIAYTGSIVGPATIGFVAGRTGLRGALLIPLGLILCICAAAGHVRAAAGAELART